MGLAARRHRLMPGCAGLHDRSPYATPRWLASDFVLGSEAGGPTVTPAALASYTAGRTFVYVDIDPTQIGRVSRSDSWIVSAAWAALVCSSRWRATIAAPSLPAVPPGRELPQRRATIPRRTHFANVPQAAAGLREMKPRVSARIPVRQHESACRRSRPAQFRHLLPPRH